MRGLALLACAAGVAARGGGGGGGGGKGPPHGGGSGGFPGGGNPFQECNMGAPARRHPHERLHYTAHRSECIALARFTRFGG